MKVYTVLIGLVYAAVHIYLYRKALLAFSPSFRVRLFVAAFLALMTATPMVIRILDWRGLIFSARLLGIVGHMWMALAFWLCCIASAGDSWNATIRLVGLGAPRLRRFSIGAKQMMLFAFAVSGLALFWSLYEATTIKVEKIPVTTSRLPPGSPPIRIVQISDVHLGIHRGELLARQVARVIRELSPDLLLSTGDLLDSSARNVAGLARHFETIRPPLGKYAVLGNHEYYVGVQGSLFFHRIAGFTVLREAAVDVGPLKLLGIDDSAGHYTEQLSMTNETRLMSGAPDRKYTILMKHQPIVTMDAALKIDLQLSGHTHKGQLFPFHWFVKLVYPLDSGLHEIDGGARLYVSRGAGTWGPPLRLFAPPEISLFVLRPAER